MNSETLGWHENDYEAHKWVGTPDLPIDQSALFGEVKNVDEDVLDFLKVGHPDQYAARMLGTALPFFALVGDPANSYIEFEQTAPEDAEVKLVIRDKNGLPLLSHERGFWGWSSDHLEGQLLALPGHLQGHGLANPMYAAQTAYAKDLGFKSIQIRANLAVGGYAWPLLGYDFASEEYLEFYRDRLKRYLAFLGREGLLSKEQVSRYRSRVNRFNRAWDFSLFRIPEGVGMDSAYDPNWREIGKKMMRGEAYRAWRHLRDPEAFKVMDKTIRGRLRRAGLLK